MAIKVWSLFEKFKLSELNNNFAELDERTSNINNTSDAIKNVLSATKLTTARTINLIGDVTGSVSTDFSTNPSITTTVVNNSHNHNEMVRIDLTGQTLDINTLTLSDGSKSKFYVERTDGGSAGITNIPVSGFPFILNVESVRHYSTIDYTTIQTFMVLSLNNTLYEGIVYKRHCLKGTWGNWYEEYSSRHKQPDVAKLTTARTISLTGDVIGSVSFDGSANVSITSTVADDSETPTASNLGTITTHTAIRKGGVVRYKLEANSGNWTGGTSYKLCTLSLNYRPVVAFSKRIMLTETINALFLIGTDGYVYITPGGSINGSALRIDETYTI